MEVALVLLREGGERRTFALTHDVTTIGRAEGCDMRIPLGEVSRKHCSIVKSDDDQLVIQDLGSSNGTFVNSRRVQQVALAAGDQIRVGSVRFVVQIDGKPPESELDDFTTVSERTAPEQPAVAATDSGRHEPVSEQIADLFEDDDEDFP